jgi:hypothetical protein
MWVLTIYLLFSFVFTSGVAGSVGITFRSGVSHGGEHNNGGKLKINQEKNNIFKGGFKRTDKEILQNLF